MCFCFWSDSTWKFTFENLKTYYHELSVPITEFTKSVTLIVHKYLLVPFAHIKAFHPLFHIHSSNLVFCWRCTSNHFFLSTLKHSLLFFTQIKSRVTNNSWRNWLDQFSVPNFKKGSWLAIDEKGPFLLGPCGWGMGTVPTLWVTVLSVGDKL